MNLLLEEIYNILAQELFSLHGRKKCFVDRRDIMDKYCLNLHCRDPFDLVLATIPTYSVWIWLDPNVDHYLINQNS